MFQWVFSSYFSFPRVNGDSTVKLYFLKIIEAVIIQCPVDNHPRTRSNVLKMCVVFSGYSIGSVGEQLLGTSLKKFSTARRGIRFGLDDSATGKKTTDTVLTRPAM